MIIAFLAFGLNKLEKQQSVFQILKESFCMSNSDYQKEYTFNKPKYRFKIYLYRHLKKTNFVFF